MTKQDKERNQTNTILDIINLWTRTAKTEHQTVFQSIWHSKLILNENFFVSPLGPCLFGTCFKEVIMFLIPFLLHDNNKAKFMKFCILNVINDILFNI